MANTIDFNVSTNAVTVLNQTGAAAENTAKGFTSAKAELRALNQQLLTMDKTSDAFKKASTRAAELKDDISDLSAEINANAGNAFEGLSNNVGLFGSRLMSLDLKGAGQALSGMGNAVSRIDFKTLKDEVGGLAKGFGDLAFSVIANPYIILGGALVGLGYIFRKDLLAPITDVIAANEKLRSSIQFTSEEIAAAAGDETKQISKLEQLKIALNDTTISTEKRKEAINELKKINPIYFKDLDDEKIKYTELNTQIDNYVKGLIAQSLAKAASARIEQEAGKYLDEEIKRRDQLSNANARLAIAQAELADKSKAVEESGKNIFGGKSYGAGYERAKTTAAATGYSIQQLELEIKTLNEAEFASKAAYEQRVADLVNFKKIQDEIAAGFGVTPPPPDKTKELEAAELARQKELEANAIKAAAELKLERELADAKLKVQQDYIHANQGAQANELYDLENKKKLELQTYEGAEEDKVFIIEKYRLAEIDINKKYDDLALQQQLEADAKAKEDREKLNEANAIQAVKELEADKKLEEDKRKLALDTANARLEIAQQGFTALSALGDAYFSSQLANVQAGSKAELDLKKKQFAFNKKMQIGGAIMDTAKAITAAIAANPFPSPTLPVSIALASITGAAQIAKIASTKFDGGGGSGGGVNIPTTGADGTTAPSPANFAFLQNQPNQQPPLQAYVVGTQVSSNLEAQQLIQNQSRLGG
jgi:hypothetical protein